MIKGIGVGVWYISNPRELRASPGQDKKSFWSESEKKGISEVRDPCMPKRSDQGRGP